MGPVAHQVDHQGIQCILFHCARTFPNNIQVCFKVLLNYNEKADSYRDLEQFPTGHLIGWHCVMFGSESYRRVIT